MFSKVEIKQDGPVASVKIDGVEIGQMATTVTVQLRGGCAPMVTVEFPADGIDVQTVASVIKKKPLPHAAT